MSMRSQRTLATLYILISFLFNLLQGAATLRSNYLSLSPDLSQGDLTEDALKQEASLIEASGAPHSVLHDPTKAEGGERLLNEEEKEMERGKTESHKTHSPGFLLYEVQRDMAALTLDDIEYILDLGEDILSYSLGDKLGYLNNDDDPHVNVIESNKASLIRKLESQRAKLIDTAEGVYEQKKTALQYNPVTTLPPPPLHTYEQGNAFVQSKVAYEVVKGINGLSVEAIDSVLGFDPDLESLPYALSQELGYGEDVNGPYFQYLAGKGDSVLREILEKAKKNKLEQSLKADRNHAAMTSDSSQEPISLDKAPLRPVESDQGKEERLTSVELPGRTSNKGTSSNILYHHDDEDIDKELTPQNEFKVTLTLENAGEVEIDVDELELDEETKALFIEILNNKPFIKYLYDSEGDLYAALSEGEVDEFITGDLLQEYSEWLDATKDDDQDRDKTYGMEIIDELDGDIEESRGRPSEDNEIEGEIQLVEGSEDKASDDGAELDEDEDLEYLDEYYGDNESTRFGAWHFLMIFIFLGVLVVLGYLCLHNRKKIREGIESYVGNANKRRQRAREYKPVLQAADDIQ